MQNGMLPIALPTNDCQALAEDAETSADLEVDLEDDKYVPYDFHNDL